MSFVWDVVVTRYWGTGDGSVRRVGDRPPDVRMPWADVIDRAVCLAGPGATVTVRVVVPAKPAGYRVRTTYRMQLPRSGGAS